MSVTSYTLTPIGLIHTPYTDKYLAPRQAGLQHEPVEGIITLFPDSNFEQALEDLNGFERVWILSWFHKVQGWAPKVLPPRAGRAKKGLFATRSPHRPNPIGLSLCELLEVKGRTVRVANPDLLDGTPIIDIKPYLSYTEAFPEAKMGWLDSIEQSPEETYTVTIDDPAVQQAAWLNTEHGIDILKQAVDVLSRDPHPHPSRRTKIHPEGGHVLAIKSWRVGYAITGTSVVIRKIMSGYDESIVVAGEGETLHDQVAHVAFHKRWPA